MFTFRCNVKLDPLNRVPRAGQEKAHVFRAEVLNIYVIIFHTQMTGSQLRFWYARFELIGSSSLVIARSAAVLKAENT